MKAEKEFVRFMAGSTGFSGATRREVPCVDLLSRIAGMDLKKFVRQHSTLPFRRSFTSYLPEVLHGDPKNQGLLNLAGMRLARQGAYFCLECVKSDHEICGMSYWRRDHQIPGVSQCSKHLKSLHYVDQNDAFLDPPSKFITDSHIVKEEWSKIDQEHDGVQRFIAISRELLEREKPFDVKTVRIVLRERAILYGLCTHNGTNAKRKRGPEKSLLSDFVKTAFPSIWLRTVLPLLADKKDGVKLDQMDGVLYLSTSASTVVPYILACCILFDTVDDALNALLNAEPIETTPPRRCVVVDQIDPVILRAAYVRAKGQYSELFVEFRGKNKTVISALESIGLPNLTWRGNQSLLRAVTAFYIDGQSIAESANAGEIQIDALEYVIRQGGAQLAAALIEFNTPRSGRGTGILRVRPLSPIEAGTINEPKHELASIDC